MRSDWFIVGFVSALALAAVSKWLGFDPGATNKPGETAAAMACMAGLSFFAAIYLTRK